MRRKGDIRGGRKRASRGSANNRNDNGPGRRPEAIAMTTGRGTSANKRDDGGPGDKW